MTTPFVVFALPRSRTAWVSRYLSYADWSCCHEEVRHARSMEDVTAWFSQPCTGTVETAAAPWWRFLRDRDVKVATIRRPVAECVDSMMRLGVLFDEAKLIGILTKQDHKLDQIEHRLPGVLSLGFGELSSEDSCRTLFEHCLPYRHDHDWWQAMAPVNLQVNMMALMRHYAAYQPQMTKFALMAKHRTISGMGRSPEIDGMMFQQETIDRLLTDGRALFAEHAFDVGEPPESYLTKNIPLLRRLDELGALQVMVARSNGRMFAYLITIVAPSLEACDVLSGQNTLFYASKDVPGLGMKLQREALQKLRARGVKEVFMRAGVRGAGKRISTIYRRLGAEDFGQMFRLELN